MRSPTILLPVMLAAVALASPACATVESGQVAVVTAGSNGAPTVLGEGLHALSPLDSVETYQTRLQERTERMVALSADGAPIVAGASVLTFHLVQSEIVALSREIGPDYYQRILRPTLQAATMQVFSRIRAANLTTPYLRAAELQIAALARPTLSRSHIALESVVLRDVRAVAPLTYAKIVAAADLEQVLQAMTHRLELARRQAANRREQAHGEADALRAVAPTLSPLIVEDIRIRAWNELLRSPETTIHLVDQTHNLIELP